MKTELKLKIAREGCQVSITIYSVSIHHTQWNLISISYPSSFKKMVRMLIYYGSEKNFCFLYPMGATSTWHQKLFFLPVLFSSKPSLLRKLFSSGIWDYFLIVLSFSVCFKFKSLSPAFSGVLWPPIFSIKRSATIMCHQWQELLTLWAGSFAAVSIVFTQCGGEASDILLL